MEALKDLTPRYSVLLFMEGTPDFPQCGCSAFAVGALNALRLSYFAYNILENLSLKKELGDHAFPQLFVNAERLLCGMVIKKMYESAELLSLIQKAKGDPL